MLTFFRKIRKGLLRKGALSKYLLYAIGEILLVMIGILLALQVNNWNTERIETKKVKDYAFSLVNDLEVNRKKAIYSKKGMEVINVRIDSLRNYVRNKNIEELSNLDFLCFSLDIQYPAFSWRRSTIDELKSSEGFRLIKNDSLLNLIFAYDALTDHLDEDYQKDIRRSDAIGDELSKIANTNYPNMNALDEVLNIFMDADRSPFEYLDSPEYRKAKTYPMSLLTDDINDIHILINRLLRLKSAYEIRCGEMMTLKEDIDEIMALLKSNYLD